MAPREIERLLSVRRQRDYRDEPPWRLRIGHAENEPGAADALARQGDGAARYPDRELRRQARDDLVLVGPPDENEGGGGFGLRAQRSVGEYFEAGKESGDRGGLEDAPSSPSAAGAFIMRPTGLFVLEAGEDLGDGGVIGRPPRLRAP